MVGRKSRKFPDFEIKIKDPDKCRIMKAYDLSERDQAAMDQEVQHWIDSGKAHWQRIDEVVHHASPGFIVHHLVGYEGDIVLLKSRAVIDFQAINDNSYKLHLLCAVSKEEFVMTLSEWRYFNIVDMNKYFFQIQCSLYSQRYCAVSLK